LSDPTDTLASSAELVYTAPARPEANRRVLFDTPPSMPMRSSVGDMVPV
jgi:hypothetical protein